MPSIKRAAQIVNQRGVCGIRVTFRDSIGQNVTPTEARLYLTALDGTFIIYRRVVTPTSHQHTFALSGDDTDFLEGEEDLVERFVYVQYDYNSDLGSLSDVTAIRFRIKGMKMYGTPLSIDVADTVWIGEYVLA